jgi:hypothetical protein
MVAHRDLTGADLHEPKGAETASLGAVYVANGSGSGTWRKLTTAELDTQSIKNVNKEVVALTMRDVGTASVLLLPLPFAATVTRITAVLHGAISGADGVLSFTNNGSASLGTMTLLHASSGEGTAFSLTPATNAAFTAGTYLKIANDGAATGTVDATLLIELTYT